MCIYYFWAQSCSHFQGSYFMIDLLHHFCNKERLKIPKQISAQASFSIGFTLALSPPDIWVYRSCLPCSSLTSGYFLSFYRNKISLPDMRGTFCLFSVMQQLFCFLWISAHLGMASTSHRWNNGLRASSTLDSASFMPASLASGTASRRLLSSSHLNILHQQLKWPAILIAQVQDPWHFCILVIGIWDWMTQWIVCIESILIILSLCTFHNPFCCAVPWLANVMKSISCPFWFYGFTISREHLPDGSNVVVYMKCTLLV